MDIELASMLFDEEKVSQNVGITDDKYSNELFSKVHYIPVDVKPGICEIMDTSKYESILENIEASTVSEADKKFLRLAAARHIVFNYGKIADYYANSSAEVQKLMEESGLVILDMDDAIAHGYVKCATKINEILDQDLAINLKLRAEREANKNKE